jgi:hypothetical protein
MEKFYLKGLINNNIPPTHNIANKGFSGMRRFVARFNFLCDLIGNHPQSLTVHIVKRYQTF